MLKNKITKCIAVAVSVAFAFSGTSLAATSKKTVSKTQISKNTSKQKVTKATKKVASKSTTKTTTKTATKATNKTKNVPSALDANVIAKIYGNNINVNEYKTMIVLMSAQYYGTGELNQDVNGTKAIDVIRKNALDYLVENEVSAIKAQKLSVKFSTQQQTVFEAAYEDGIKGFKEEYQSIFSDMIKGVGLNETQFNSSYKKLYSNAILKTLLRDKLVKDKAINTNISDTVVNNVYKNTFTTVKAKHILITFSKHKEADALKIAQNVLSQLKKGANFEQLAKKYSEDPGSAQSGGDLGLFGRGEMVTEFENAAFDLKVGQISGLVKTTYGYHIIKVYQKNVPDIKNMTADQKQSIIQSQQNNVFESYILKCEKEANATINGKAYNVTITVK